jgi:HrpA-like RNA helicase
VDHLRLSNECVSHQLVSQCRAYSVEEHYLPPCGASDDPADGRRPQHGDVAAKVAEVDRGAPAGEHILVFMSGVAGIDAVVALLEKMSPAAQVSVINQSRP